MDKFTFNIDEADDVHNNDRIICSELKDVIHEAMTEHTGCKSSVFTSSIVPCYVHRERIVRLMELYQKRRCTTKNRFLSLVSYD
jgi:hypothetical protein